jgi:hypothetical protein
MVHPSSYTALTLFHVVEAVQAIATDDAEVVATVVSLINSGRVRLCGALAGATIALPSLPPLRRGSPLPVDAGASDTPAEPGSTAGSVGRGGWESPTRFQATPLAGHLVIAQEQFGRWEYDRLLRPRDCLLFEEKESAHLPKSLKLMGQTVEAPATGKLYCLNDAGGLEALDLVHFK